MFRVTKTFPHSLGLSCCFRQWRAASSHCRFLHGYAIEVDLGLIADELDGRNWVFDFGDFDRIKNLLRETFDHKTIIAADDPERKTFEDLRNAGIIQLLIMEHVGCEAFARFVYEAIRPTIQQQTSGRVDLGFVTIREHGANSATYSGLDK